VTNDVMTERLRLTLVDRDAIAAVLAGERERAEGVLRASLPDGWPDEGDRWLLELRQGQLRDDPDIAPWLLRAIVLVDTGEMIGHIGFHGPPDARGFVEVGYAIVSEHRRMGFAREAVTALFGWARERGVKGFRASVGPWNDPSLGLIAQLGFRQTGVQWDEQDGEELVFETERSHDSFVRA
jgi:RimJ/RimL family protein N-acetyltransferase